MVSKMPPFIDPALHTRIQTELGTIERQEGVKILLAVESGSRAWGFPSRDSDYDVRFLYLRSIERYLAVTAPRDVIERPVDAGLDISGWDLRKALQLMLRSNAILVEWLTSPVRYRGWAGVDELLALTRSAARPTALAYHYRSQARRSFEAIGETNLARLKSYCYALRSSLAVAWIRQRGEAPPMDAETLMAGVRLPQDLVEQIRQLIARKLIATEDATMPRSAIFDAFISDALSAPLPETMAPACKEVSARADAFFAALLLDRTGAADAPKAGSTCF
jgi:predicted nucleotidyltransferase